MIIMIITVHESASFTIYLIYVPDYLFVVIKLLSQIRIVI